MLLATLGSPSMARYSLDEFVETTRQKDLGEGLFELEQARMLEVNLNGRVWMKTGAMVAYRGGIKFTREGLLEHGLGKMLKRSLTGEGAQLTKAEGAGKMYLADQGKKISILNLQGESLFVNGNDLLAFEDTVKWDIRIMRKVTAMLAGGLFSVKLEGHGMVAIASHYDPITLTVDTGQSLFTDPNATVAWSGGLTPEFKADVSLRTFLGRGSGESFQMLFKGKGFVVVQPYEEVVLQRQAGS